MWHDQLSFRDLGFSIRGEAVGELETIFHETWNSEQDESAAPLKPERLRQQGLKIGDAAVNIISGGPRQRRSFIREAFQVNIASAAEEILIATPYFVPGPRIIRSLLTGCAPGRAGQIAAAGSQRCPDHAAACPQLLRYAAQGRSRDIRDGT